MASQQRFNRGIRASTLIALLVAACQGTTVPAGTTGASAAPPETLPTTAAATVVPSPRATVVPSPSPRPVPSIDPSLPIPSAVDPMGACAPESQLCTLMDVATWSAIPFTPEVPCYDIGLKCRVLANVYGPTHPGHWPLFVLVSGADSYESPDAVHSAYIDDFAKQLAGRGAVVMRANWRRNPSQGAGYPASFGDIACAIGVARRIGARYGADATRVVLVGHSNGSWASMVVGLTATPFTPATGSCDEVSGSLRPDAWAGLAPPLANGLIDGFIGADASQAPDAWKSVDAFTLIARSKAANRVPVTLIVGDLDDVVSGARKLDAALTAAGFENDLIVEANVDHYHVLDRAESIEALLALAARVRG